MQVPEDYILEIIRSTLDDKIDTLENNLKSEISSLKTEIISLNSEFKNFNSTCKHDMGLHEKRIRTNEDFRIKVIAIAGSAGAIAAFIFTLIPK